MRKVNRYLLPLLCLLTFLQGAGAVPMWESSLSFRRFTTIDGLPQMQTETVWQDTAAGTLHPSWADGGKTSSAFPR